MYLQRSSLHINSSSTKLVDELTVENVFIELRKYDLFIFYFLILRSERWILDS